VEETQRLSEFSSGLMFENIPAPVRRRSALLLLDLWGIMIRARNDSDSAECVIAAAQDLGWRGGACSVVGDPDTYAAAGAAFLNGAFAHTLDFDDTHTVGSLHPSASVVPAALCAAEIAGASGRTLLSGIVAGYEVVCRLGHALVPAEHYDRGFHPTATAGAFGAAAAASRVLGLDSSRTAAALGAVLSHSAGTMQFLANGSWNKRTQVGGAAMNGILAALLARHGFLGASEPIEGRYGFLSAYAPNAVPERATAGLGVLWETLNIGIKPYPSCRFTHAAVDIILDQVRNNNLRAEDVESVTVGLPRKSIDIVGVPEAQKRRPRSVVEAQFSMHFGVALALREGKFAWDDYHAHIGSPETDALCDRVTVVNDPEAEALYPEHLSATVELRTKAGTRRILVKDPKGEPTNWLGDAELLGKFEALASPYLGDERTATLAGRLLDIANAPDVREVLDLSRPEASQTGGRHEPR